MKSKTYFLDKIFNKDFKYFDEIVQQIITDLGYENFSYTFLKKGEEYILDLEFDEDFATIYFDDYSLTLKKANSNLNYSNYWQVN